MTVPIRPPDPRVMKALAAYKKQGLNRLADLSGLSQGTGDAVQSFAMGATEPLDVKGALRAARRGIEAWHGSPHKFDKFSLEKIGTGEGAQAYGHGLYFAEAPEVARGYRDAITSKNGGNQHGSLYRVRLDVSPDELLDWDAPADGQGLVTQALDELGYDVYGFMGKGRRGSRYAPHNIAEMQAMSEKGIKGVRYLDEGSRAANDGTRNYVIFDPERIQILERLAALGIGGEAVRTMLAQAKAAAQPQQSQPPTLPAVTVGR